MPDNAAPTDSATQVVGVNPQEQHYVQIHDAYTAHYFDPVSEAYRSRFIFDPLCRGLDLSSAHIADLACGAGQNSQILAQRFPGATFEGFDISAPACAAYRGATGAIAHKVDLTAPLEIEPRFDAVMVIGGLHHCVANLDTAMRNIAAMLRPGGVLMMYEPYAGYLLEPVRRAWYHMDKYFDAPTECALDPGDLLAAQNGRFTADKTFYTGGPAYFVLFQSLVLRVPLGMKKPLAAPLFAVESLWNRIPFAPLFPAFGAVWRRTQASLETSRP
ncbi:MAG: class I SAM-dependent methyltransferase [Hyphomonadaceae bacterium]|nr:class I SAM-dependent methyltransferase [Hyphomonadaceae bacterium]